MNIQLIVSWRIVRIDDLFRFDPKKYFQSSGSELWNYYPRLIDLLLGQLYTIYYIKITDSVLFFEWPDSGFEMTPWWPHKWPRNELLKYLIQSGLILSTYVWFELKIYFLFQNQIWHLMQYWWLIINDSSKWFTVSILTQFMLLAISVIYWYIYRF